MAIVPHHRRRCSAAALNHRPASQPPVNDHSIASQYEPAEWFDQIPIPVAAEAITDRLAAQAYKIIIRGNTSKRLAG